MVNADLTNTVLSDCSLQKALINRCRVYGSASWQLNLEGAQQQDLIITKRMETDITVDDIEVAQFLHLLLDHKKLRSVLNAVTRKGVLLLGRFGGGGPDVLRSVADTLRSDGYLPIIFDFKRPENQDYTETILTLASLSRFVIADLSGPSVPQELQACVEKIKVPYVGIIEKDRNVYSTFKVLLQYLWVGQRVVEFAGIDDLIRRIHDEMIVPAEDLRRRRAENLHRIFDES